MTSKLAIFTTVLLLSSAAAHADLSISNKPTKHVSCSAGVCVAKKPHALLNAADLATMLAAGDVEIDSNSAAPDIVVAAHISWTSPSRLTLKSYRSIIFEQSVAVAGSGALTIITNTGMYDRDFWFTKNGHIQFWDISSSLIINGTTYQLVKSVRQLAKAILQDVGGSFALAKNYDAGKDGTYAQAPIRDEAGTIEGLGNTINQLTVDDPDYQARVGLFAQARGTIRDLSLTNVLISVEGSSTVEGGLVGNAYGPILNCSVSGSVSGGEYVGGLAGSTENDVQYSSASASVQGILDGFSEVGGLVGETGYPVEYSYATGPVIGGQYALAGGLVGVSTEGLYWSYATGSVTAGPQAWVGGLNGASNVEKITQTYAVGALSGEEGSMIGGLIGMDDDTYSNDYWDMDTTGATQGTGNGNVSGIVGLTDAQLKSALPAGFDPNIWGQSPKTNNGYPYLLANPPQ